MLSVIYADCHLWRVPHISPFAECLYAECLYAECRYAECRYAECRYVECRGPLYLYNLILRP
jgi:hypothetical protein